MRLTPWLTGLALVVLAAPAAAEPVTLARLVRARQVPYQGELVVNGKTVIRVSHGTGDRLRHEVLSPPTLVGELIVDNGRTRWHYSPRNQRVDVGPSSASPLSLDASERLLARNFRLVASGSRTIAGRATVLAELVPARSRLPVRRLWLDVATGLPLRTERLDRLGKVSEVSEFRQLRAPATVPPETFEFMVPAQARVTNTVQLVASGRSLAELQGQLPFTARLPGYLPEGFELMDVHLIETRGVQSLHLRLSDGLDILSLFQAGRVHQAMRPEAARSVQIGRTEGFLTQHGGHPMLCWATPDGAFTLMGDLDQGQLIKIGASLSP